MPMQVDDFLGSTILTKPIAEHKQPNISTPPVSPPTQTKIPGGEMERLRQEKLTQIHELESRRPDYLKRMKRTLAESEAADDDTSAADIQRFSSIGITETPNKGRRLKLFQETSEESFEESLMAGGYGRYVCYRHASFVLRCSLSL